MHHLAIMEKSLGFLPKIVSGKKIIESSWYKNKIVPWDKAEKDDVIFLKNSGDPVTVKAVVDKVIQFENLDEFKIREILLEYYKELGLKEDELSISLTM